MQVSKCIYEKGHATNRLELVHRLYKTIIRPIFVAVRLFEVPPEPLIQHGRSAFSASALGNFFELELVDMGHLIGDQVDCSSTRITNHESLT